jgi:hypothetical protein
MKNKNTLLPIILIVIILIIVIIIFIYLYHKNKSFYTKCKPDNTEFIKNLSKIKICGTPVTDPPECNNKLKAVINPSKKWDQNSKITIKFLDEPDYANGFYNTYRNGYFPQKDDNYNDILYDPLEKTMYDGADILNKIQKIITQRYERFTNLTFIFLPSKYNSNADIKISFVASKGSYSQVGTDCKNVRDKNKETMNFGWFDVKTVLHEFGHALGLEHEHQSPFQKERINWNLELLNAYFLKTNGWDETKVYNNIIKPLDADVTIGTEYDINSIMHYFYPKELTCLDKNCTKKPGKGSKVNARLSPIDVIYISSLYPVDPKDIYPKSYKKDPLKFYEEVYE